MTAAAFYAVEDYVKSGANPYDAFNGSAVYEEINDTIRNRIPDSIIFEIFLTKITAEQVCVDVYIPDNRQLISAAECAYIRAAFSPAVPPHRQMRVFVYTNPDGSGDLPLKEAISNKPE